MKSFKDLCSAFEDAETMLELAKEMDDEESMAEGVTMLNDLADPVRQVRTAADAVR